MSEPQIGDFFVTPTGGDWFHRLIAKAIQWDTDSPYNHAGIYVGNGKIMEARPGGAGLNFVDTYDGMVWSHFDLTAAERSDIVAAALECAGKPYGWLDIAAIALAQKRLGATVDSETWWVKRVSNIDTLICSQLVDLCYGDAGVHLFNDGRLPGLVSPGDLGRLLDPVPAR